MALFVSCQKASINGDLDGRWQILEIVPEPGNVKNAKLYYSFYLHVCNLTYYGGVFTEGNMAFRNDSLYMDFPYVKTEEDFNNLKRFGVYSNPVVFKIEYLDKNKLVLKNGDISIILRKF